MPHEGRSFSKAQRALSPARSAALEMCSLIRQREAFAHDVIDSHLPQKHLQASDYAFATCLVLGVVSSVGTLDELIDRVVSRPRDVQPAVRDALRISTYELYFLKKGTHAAVDQGVELVRSVAPKAAGLANAVLRKLAKMRVDFPFGDPRTNIAACARLHSFPEWLAQKLVDDLGFSQAVTMMSASNEPAPLFISVNAIKCSDEKVIKAFEAAGSIVKPVASTLCTLEGCYLIDSGKALQHSAIQKLIKQGAFLVADASSQTVARLALPETAGASLLEIGAGRGTKTIMLQSNAQRAYASQLALTSLDTMDFKVRLLTQRAKEYGVSLDRALVGDGTKLDLCVGNTLYDTVFIDAPCTGLGTLRRHPEIRWRIKPAAIANMATLGSLLLQSAAYHVIPGGKLVYATCTVTREENVETVARFLQSEAGSHFKLQALNNQPCFASRLSSGSPDAHFAAVLRRL